MGRLLRAARAAGVPVTHLAPGGPGEEDGSRAVHQGVAAVVAPVAYATADALCEAAARERSGLLVVLDGIEDPRNLGAVIRTAAAAGAHGILLGVEETVGITPAVAKTAAGALERIPVAREPKLVRRLTGPEVPWLPAWWPWTAARIGAGTPSITPDAWRWSPAARPVA